MTHKDTDLNTLTETADKVYRLLWNLKSKDELIDEMLRLEHKLIRLEADYDNLKDKWNECCGDY